MILRRPTLLLLLIMKSTNTYCVYIHISKIDGKVYVGQTMDGKTKQRWQNGNGYKRQYFYQGILKDGWDNFHHIILETGLSKTEVEKKEKYWIKYYDATNPIKGYNRDTGGGGKSLATKEKMKASWASNPERRKKQSDLMKFLNAKMTFEERSAYSGMKGTHRTGKDSARARKVQCIETGQIFDTIIEAAKWSNHGKISSKSHISDVCKGKRKTCGKHPITNKPLHWRYYN